MKKDFIKKTILLASFLCSLAHSYSEKDIRLSDYEYNRYVKGGLKDILKEYFALYQSLNPQVKNSYTQFILHSNIRNSFQKLNKIKEVEEMVVEIKKIKKLTHELLSANTQEINFNEKKNFTENEVLLHLEAYQKYKDALFDFYLSFQTSETLNAAIKIKQFINIKIKQHLELEALFFSFLSNTSDNRFRRDFSAFENDFIRPVQKYILPAPNKKNFIARINQLNLSMTKLNVALTKRNKKISKQSESLIKIYHRRWNNILKVTLKR